MRLMYVVFHALRRRIGDAKIALKQSRLALASHEFHAWSFNWFQGLVMDARHDRNLYFDQYLVS